MAHKQFAHTDIDIDFADRSIALSGIAHIQACIEKNGHVSKHPSGVYFQDVPVDPVSGLCAFAYDQAEQYGYFKIDFLNSSIYEGVRDEDHLNALLSQEPDWLMLEHEAIVDSLSHIRSHFGLVKMISPRSIEDLAIVLALMRPGKRHLMGKSRAEIDAAIWEPESDGYTFKKSHAIAYAAAIVVQMNLMCEEMVRKMEAGEVEI